MSARRLPTWIFVSLLAAVPGVSAQERLCDASAENCRVPLISLIDNEKVGIDVGVWFFKDDRFVQALIRAQNRGVPIRMLMDTRANNSYPENKTEFDKLIAAGIPMRRRIAGDILHWKLMIFTFGAIPRILTSQLEQVDSLPFPPMIPAT